MIDKARVERAIANAQAAGDVDAVGLLQQLLADEAKATPSGMAWGDVGVQAIKNLPSSGAAFARDMVYPIMHPIETINGMAGMAEGAGRQLIGMAVPDGYMTETSPEWEAVKGFYGDRYGDMEKVKKALATDPVGVLADASTVLTGGAGIAARAPGTVGKIGRIAGQTGRAIDPASIAGRSAGTVGRGIRNFAGYSSGVDQYPIQRAFDAHRAGGYRRRVFQENLNEQVPLSNVVDDMKRGLENIKNQRRNEYRQNIQSTRNSTAMIKIDPIVDTLNKTLDDMFVNGNWAGNSGSLGVARNIVNDIQQWASSGAASTPWGLDRLKQKVSGYIKTPGPGVEGDAAQANRIAEVVRDAIDTEIRKADPNYANTMDRYATASDTIRELERTFSLHPNASVDTQLRKLQSTMRNNVQTNYGQRINLAEELDAAGSGTALDALAGQSLNQWMPRGIARAGGAMALPATAAAFAINPASALSALAVAPFSSPKLVANVAGLLGDAARGYDSIPAQGKRAVETAVSRPVRNTMQQTSNAVQATERNDIVMIDANGLQYDAKGNVYDPAGRLIERKKQ